MQLAAKDHRPLPPAARLQRAQGRALQYQLQYLVQSITQPALDAEAFEAGPAAAQARERALRLGEGSS